MITKFSIKPNLAAIGYKLILLFVIALLTTGLSPFQGFKTPYYLLIIDAGSSGSRIYIYQVESDYYGDVPKIIQLGSKKVTPGISAWGEDPERDRSNLASLIQAAAQQIPEGARKQTPLYVMATAGMRILSDNKRERIIKAISDYLKHDGTFNFKSAVTISGTYEALYAWIALNYLDDQFNPSMKREGTLEMGGASTQIAFTVPRGFKGPKIRRFYRGEKYKIVAKSYLYMGSNEAAAMVSSANCFPKGFPISEDEKGAGNFDLCILDIQEKFNTLCESLECNGPHCIFQDEFIINTQQDYLAFSAYWHTFNFLKMNNPIMLEALQKKGSELCAADWETLKEKYSDIPVNFLRTYCFNAAYYLALFQNGYRFPENATNINTADRMNGMEITWTLGAAVDLEYGYAPEQHSIKE